MITGNEGSMFEIGIAYWEPGMWEIQDWLLSMQIDAWIATEFTKTAMGDPLHATGNLWGEEVSFEFYSMEQQLNSLHQVQAMRQLAQLSKYFDLASMSMTNLFGGPSIVALLMYGAATGEEILRDPNFSSITQEEWDAKKAAAEARNQAAYEEYWANKKAEQAYKHALKVAQEDAMNHSMSDRFKYLVGGVINSPLGIVVGVGVAAVVTGAFLMGGASVLTALSVGFIAGTIAKLTAGIVDVMSGGFLGQGVAEHFGKGGMAAFKALEWGYQTAGMWALGGGYVPLWRAYGGLSNSVGRSWTWIPPHLVPRYTYWAGLPHFNTGRFWAFGWTRFGNIKWTTAKPWMKQLSYNQTYWAAGGLPEAYLRDPTKVTYWIRGSLGRESWVFYPY